MKPLSLCHLVLEGEDARRFEEYMNNPPPPTEYELEIRKRVKKELERMDHDEFLAHIRKRNCANCACDCDDYKEHVCTHWVKKE